MTLEIGEGLLGPIVRNLQSRKLTTSMSSDFGALYREIEDLFGEAEREAAKAQWRRFRLKPHRN